MPYRAGAELGTTLPILVSRIKVIQGPQQRRQGEKNVMGQGLHFFARIALVVASLVVVSCGSGGVGVPPVNDPNTITILPNNATLYSGLPTTFSITGGTGAYIVSSSNQAVVQVAAQTLVGNTLTVIPNSVLVDTPVTLTARDTSTTTPASVTFTVRPGTVNNQITITPSSTQGGSCSPAICSGGDAVVSATLSQGGIPLPARGVRFDVISGDVRFITSPVGAAETLAPTITTITDETGKALARMRVTPVAPNQTAIIQVTDLGSGAFQRTTFVIAQATDASPGFFTVPTAVTFTGPRVGQCASSGSSEILIFGGVPPYRVTTTAPSALGISREFVSFSGGSTTVTPLGACGTFNVVITDATGRTTTVQITNQEGTATLPALLVSPETLSINSCTVTANAVVVGGSGSYTATSSSPSVLATVSGGTLSVRRVVPSNAPPATVTVGVTDGTTLKTVSVTFTGSGAGTCLGATPASVSFVGCGTPQNVTLSGGTGAYTLGAPAPTGVNAVIAGSTLTVTRLLGSAAGSTTVQIRDAGDATATGAVPVTLSGTCP
jgi:hypothetical protein